MPLRDWSALPDAGPPTVLVELQAFAARLFRASSILRTKTINAGQTADNIGCYQRVFGHPPTVFARREKVPERLAQRLDPSRPLVALKFGVAWGCATNRWLRRLKGREVIWHGFDRFTGLPRAWREHDRGAFNAGGKPPPFDDDRVRWHIGDVEDCLGAVDLLAERDAQWLVQIDLDIYEPTAFAREVIGPLLRPGGPNLPRRGDGP